MKEDIQRDWWRTQITVLLKFTVTKILDEFNVRLSVEQIKKKIELEDEGIDRIMEEINTRKRYDN